MTDLNTPVSDAMAELAQLWKDFIWEGSNVKPLAASTVASKIAKGSSYPDTPLVDTEKMVNSIESGIEQVSDTEVLGWVAITDPDRAGIAIIHEYGLGPPARPTLRPVFDTHADRLLDKIFDNVFEQIESEFMK